MHYASGGENFNANLVLFFNIFRDDPHVDALIIGVHYWSGSWKDMVQFKRCSFVYWWRFGELVDLVGSEQTRRRWWLCMLHCHGYYSYGTCRRKVAEGLKSSYKGKGSKPQSGGAIFMSGAYPLASLSELPTLLSLFWFFGTVYITFLLVKTL